MIHVIGEYYIMANPNCYAAAKFNGIDKKTGQPDIRAFAYYTELSGAFECIRRRIQREAFSGEDVVDLDEACETLARIDKDFELLFEEVKERMENHNG